MRRIWGKGHEDLTDDEIEARFKGSMSEAFIDLNIAVRGLGKPGLIMGIALFLILYFL